MSELDDFLNPTLARQVEAEKAMHNGDARPGIDMWSTNDPVTLLGAWGPSNSGWDQVSRTFEWVASRFSNCTDYSFELLAAGVSGDLAYTVGFEHSVVAVDDARPASGTLRVTHIHRRENGEWKIAHRHGDHPPDDESPSAPPPATVRFIPGLGD